MGLRSWRGPGGASDHAALNAHLDILFEMNKIVYHASVRELAERPGIIAKTASVSNRRLQELGVLKLKEPSRGFAEANVETLRLIFTVNLL